MTAAWGNIVGVVTVVTLVVFVAIWAWAWLPHHKRAFDDLAKLPLEDQEDGR